MPAAVRGAGREGEGRAESSFCSQKEGSSFFPLAATLILLLAAAPAAAQGLLPATGADVRPGDLRKQFDRAYQRGPALTQPGWTVTPSADLTIAWTDAVPRTLAAARAGGRRFKSDFYTILSPGLVVQGTGPRLEGTLNLAPQLRRYLSTSSQNTIATNFAGRGKAILIRDQLWVDVTGTSAIQSRNGGQGQATNLARNDQIQTTSYSVAPTWQQRFGDLGIAELGTSFRQSFTDGQRGVAANAFSQPVATGPTTSTSTYASFVTGDILGRTSIRTEAMASEFQGGGALQGASRKKAGSEFGYKVTRVVAVIGSLGYENIRYGGTTPFRTSGLTWSGGMRLTPDPDSKLTVSYGRRDGANSASLDASYAPTARIRMSGRYSEGLSTGAEDFQNAIALSDLDATGQAVDRQTGVPISVTNNFFGAGSNTLTRTRRLTITTTILLDRDVVSLSLRRDESTNVGGAVATTSGAVTKTTGLFGTVSVQRDINPGVSANLYSQIGTRNATGTFKSSQDTISVGATLTFVLSQTLSARLEYTYTNNSSTLPGQSLVQNLVSAGLRKTF